MRFQELKTFPADLRTHYESFIRESEQIPSSQLEEFMNAGYLRMFASYDDSGEFVVGTMVAVSMLASSPVMLQSYIFINEAKSGFDLENEHVNNMLALLGREHPTARVIFEAKDLGEFARFRSLGGATCVCSSYQIPINGDTAAAEIYAYALNGRSPAVAKEQVAEWVYVMMRYLYELSAVDATDILKRSDLPTTNAYGYEALVARGGVA
jgi:hypothetical protein